MPRTSILDSVNPALPLLDGTDYDNNIVSDYLYVIHKRNSNTGFGIYEYAHGITGENNGYFAGVYTPSLNRIYMVPFSRADDTTWHYINCDTGKVIAYTHGASLGQNQGYIGGCYSPTQNRIYFSPYAESGQSNWHYVDCADGSINTYAHGVGATISANAYSGAVYSPNQNRIYFVPYGQSDQTNWHYIDCTSTGSVVAYAHGMGTLTDQAYFSGVYSPTQDRIYFIPYNISDETNWHYIDCSDGSVNAYAHGASGIQNAAYIGGAFVPTQNRIYMAPRGQSTQSDWHYIDCDDGSVVAYTTSPNTPSSTYSNCAYDPVLNKVFLMPWGQSTYSEWHYIDCTSTGSVVVAYEHGTSSAEASSYTHGIYAHTLNRIYMIPRLQGDVSTWHYIQNYASDSVPPSALLTYGSV